MYIYKNKKLERISKEEQIKVVFVDATSTSRLQIKEPDGQTYFAFVMRAEDGMTVCVPAFENVSMGNMVASVVNMVAKYSSTEYLYLIQNSKFGLVGFILSDDKLEPIIVTEDAVAQEPLIINEQLTLI